MDTDVMSIGAFKVCRFDNIVPLNDGKLLGKAG